ncbi:MAG TPA: hypothetical protein VGI40_24880 [Pirellulaceae bacterium]|jgi:hypothetical protein
MDQLRKAWEWFERQHFWVLIVVVTLVALGCWWHGATALSKQFTANKQIIDQEFSSIKGEIGKSFHANEKLKDQQTAEIKKQSDSVAEIWKRLYDRQRASVLKWPDVLSDRFRTDIERLKFGQEIPLDLRNNYRDYVGRYFPSLPKIVDAAESAANESGGGRYQSRGGGGRGYPGRGYASRESNETTEQEDEHIVQWLDQQHIRDELDMPTTPTAMKIWVTQEDLWVYETLLGIIKHTNDAAGADRASNAAVRVIESLDVGRLAALESRTPGRIEMPQAAPSPGAAAEGGGRGGPPPMAGGREMGMGRGGEMAGEGGRGGAEDAAASDAALLAGRYLDNDEKPIATVDPAAGAAAFGTEYKRLPVRMVLQMDQRWLSHLVAECANASLQVEVKEVRINPSDAGASGGGGRGGGRGGYSSSASTEGGQMTPESDSNFKRIIIQGIVYIFNEPNTAAIQVADAQK